MTKDRKLRRSSGERGIALLIAIFVLLLISVVAIALLVSSGTETALGANYRSSSTAYYAALAGLEEVRGRLLPNNTNSISSIIPSTFPLGQPIYVTNRLPGETIQPWDPSNLYYDHEYKTEFGVEASGTAWQSRPSVWDNNSQGMPGPLFKWVRINAVTEASLQTDVNSDGWKDPGSLLFYDPANIDLNGNPRPSLIVSARSTAVQVLEITAFAYLPNGSKKILQYIVAPITVNLSFPAALTLDSSSATYSPSTHNAFYIHGDGDSGDGACGTPAIPYPVPAIGVTDSNDASTIAGTIPSGKQTHYTGSTSSPSVSQVTVTTNLQTPQTLDSIAQAIIKNADAAIQGPANQSSLPAAMSTGNTLMTVAIAGDPTQPNQGNITLSGGYTGYGLLLVTGTLTLDSSVSWNGIILVIGQGQIVATSSGGFGQINGAIFVAQTRDGSGNLLSSLGSAGFNNTAGRDTIYYNCSWIAAAEAPVTYRVLSFHEIPQ
jgi:hypothetical protein